MDACFRLAYFVVYHLARVWWTIARPSVAGSNVAIWRNDELLLLKSSYRKAWQFPGGFMRKSEAPQKAAIREAREEIALILSPEDLADPVIFRSLHEHRRELNYVFEIQMQKGLDIVPDNREIIKAGYFTISDITKMKVTPTVWFYLANRAIHAGSHATL